VINKLLSCYKKLLQIIKLIGENIFLLLKFIVFDLLWDAIKTALVVGLPTMSLYVLYRLTVENSQVESLGIYVLTPLAILIALTSLLYNRARAVNIENHPDCLLAAESVFRATIHYSIAIVWGFVVASINLMIEHDGGGNIPIEILSVIYLPSLLFASFAYIDVYKTLSKVFKELKNK
jgi:hypothetical protein